MKIVIAVDDSACSRQAVEFVIRMRWPAGSRVIVASVAPLAASVVMPAYGPDVALPARTEHEELVARTEQQLRESGFATEGRLLAGDAREALVELARAERADLMVLGSHGRTGLARLMLGSVSSHAVSHAPCSVLVVKRGRNQEKG
ncbi:MAG: universal stress protein [Candidatus Eisenbacteria bacterium]|uniref:Universal stress protein n=1 Tax=Eiseniibacteriota bacterium TaxID=2212470 RepID=A0A9D6L6P2_UNCEI|nr:universal stress protein [Candidatus Eisenbacteria bacterium]MBI3539611.1 universal stress protein [Candidatus Eisenbacteria bacterium]